MLVTSYDQLRSAPVYVFVQQPRQVNHMLHGILTLITGGLWAPVWILVAITNHYNRPRTPRP